MNYLREEDEKENKKNWRLKKNLQTNTEFKKKNWNKTLRKEKSILIFKSKKISWKYNVPICWSNVIDITVIYIFIYKSIL